MTPSPLFSHRYFRIGLIAIALLWLLVLLLAPAMGQQISGSTFNRAPAGYLGWYRYMQAQGTPVQRWQRPISELLAVPSDGPKTLLQVYPRLVSPYQVWQQDEVKNWLEAGHDLVVLGVKSPLTDAPFTTRQDSPQGTVLIHTRRRYAVSDSSASLVEVPLQDEYGAIVWQQQRSPDTGRVWIAATPHLAANAYQDEPGNYDFLATLVTQRGGPIWVDEFLHGYRQGEGATADQVGDDQVGDWGTYLSRTPVKVAVAQLIFLLGLGLIAHQRRPGTPVSVSAPVVDNSQAYIEALAAVLQKAKSHTFVAEMLAKAERLSLQRALGFSEARVDDSLLQQAWTQQTGQPAQQLSPLLHPPRSLSRQADRRLAQWLQQVQQIRQTWLH